MFAKICLLRAQSVRAQLEGKQPATLSEQAAAIEAGTYKGVDVSGVDLAVLGDFDDLRNAKERQQAVLARITDAK